MTRERRDRNQGARWILAALLVIAASPPFAAPASAGQTGAIEAIELEAPVDVIWQVLTDFAAWPAFMPALERVEVEMRSQSLVAIRHETSRMGFDVKFTTLTRVDPAELRMVSSLDPEGEHDIASMRSAWQITPLGDGRVRVELRSDLDSGQPVPGFLERRMVRDSVAETVQALALEVDRRTRS